MNRESRCARCLFPLLLCTVTLAMAATASTGDPARPFNVLLVTIDTLRYDHVGILDARHVKTPHIDALAGDSLIFTRAFAHNPVTLPSHANILTGATPLRHGISDNSGFRLDAKFLTLAEYLRRRGYRTAAFVGAFPLDSRFGLDQGFDLYDDFYGARNEREFFFAERPAEKVIAPAMAWIGRQSQRWFGWIHLFDPHQPYLPPPPFREAYAGDPYSGEVAYVDAQLGRLFAFLRARGLLEKTVIVLTADHGEALGERGEDTHSYYAYNNTIHVPLFLFVPGRRPQRSDLPACHADIFPTVCDVLGLPAPPAVQGESLLAVAGRGGRQNPAIYFESLTAWLNRDWAPLRGMISGNRKFIDLPLPEVYDLDSDPDEARNLASVSRIGAWKSDLYRLIGRLKNPQAAGRERRLDPETARRLKSLGYLAENRPAEGTRVYTERDDLKTLLPLQNRLLDGVARFQSGDLDGAARTIRAVIAECPGFIMAYTHLASMYSERRRPDAAIAVLEDGLAKNPGNGLLRAKLGIVLADSGDWRRAVPILEECVGRENTDPEKFNFLGIAYYRGGDFVRALQNYNRALALDENNAAVCNNIGGLYLALFLRGRRQPDLARAERHFRRALKIDAGSYSACNGLGVVCRKSGRGAEAIAWFRRALAIKPDFDLALVNLGITLLEQGRADEALDLLLRYRETRSTGLPPAERQQIDRLIEQARGKRSPAA